MARPSLAGTRKPKPSGKRAEPRFVVNQVDGDRRGVRNCAEFFAECRIDPAEQRAGGPGRRGDNHRVKPLGLATRARPSSRLRSFPDGADRRGQAAENPGSSRATSASINCCIPPRSAVKIGLGAAGGRGLACPLFFAAAFAFARICRCAANMPRVSEPYCDLHLHQPWQNGAGAQLRLRRRHRCRRAADRQAGHGFRTKVPFDQRRDRFVGQSARARRMQQFQRHANLGGEAEQPRQRGGNQLGGHQKHEPVGQSDKAVADQDVGLAGRVV